ncbi:type 4b pilus protein PilO2 (plasmid) [Robbsia andropogonis]|uniref:type 4b pilus protein PilO2 n=1 Tax=Robbsia andropogonis TaxID=28092 RepID=UPI003D224511
MAELIELPGVKGQYAVGLNWRHEDKLPRRRELYALGQQMGRWGAVRKTATGAIQICYCDPIEGAKSPRSIAALGASVAELFPPPWMGVYKLSNTRYWLIAVRDGNEIIPGGDVVGSLSEILSLKKQFKSLEWTEKEGTIEDLAATIDQKRLPLRDLQSRPELTAAVIGGSVLAIAIAAAVFLHYRDAQLEAEARAAKKRQQAIEAALRAKRDAQSDVLPWSTLPSVMAGTDACRNAWNRQPLSIAGWDLASWTCTPARERIALAIAWKNAGGSALDAPGRLGVKGDVSTQTQSFPAQLDVGAPGVLSQDAASRAAWALASRYGFALNLQQVREPEPALPGGKKGTTSPKPWLLNTLTIGTGTPPWLGWANDASRISGLRLRSISWTGAGHAQNAGAAWSVAFDLYTANDNAPAVRQVEADIAKTAPKPAMPGGHKHPVLGAPKTDFKFD